jgi:hypothetical protein
LDGEALGDRYVGDLDRRRRLHLELGLTQGRRHCAGVKLKIIKNQGKQP